MTRKALKWQRCNIQSQNARRTKLSEEELDAVVPIQRGARQRRARGERANARQRKLLERVILRHKALKVRHNARGSQRLLACILDLAHVVARHQRLRVPMLGRDKQDRQMLFSHIHWMMIKPNAQTRLEF